MSAYRDAPAHDPRVRRRRAVFAAVWCVLVVALLIAVRAVLVPFVVAALLAYVLSPVARRFARRPGKHGAPRWAVVLGLYAVIVLALGLGVSSAAPRVLAEARRFARVEVPHLNHELTTQWLPRASAFAGQLNGGAATRPDPAVFDPAVQIEPRVGGGFRVAIPPDGIRVEREGAQRFRVLPARPPGEDGESLVVRARVFGQAHSDELLQLGRGFVFGLVGGIFSFFITLMLSAYMLLTEEHILAFARSLAPPASRDAFDTLLARIDRGLSGVVRGQLIICAVNGALSALGFGLAGLPYWPLLAVLAAVFSLVPIFGSILSSVPAVLIGLRLGLPTAVFVLVWILGIHQLEANLLNPKIMGDAAKIHPVLVVFSLLVGEHFFGFLGALLAVPVMSIVQSVFLHWREYALAYGDDAAVAVAAAPAAASPADAG